MDETSFMKARLTNLGFYCDPDEKGVGASTHNAVRCFQKAFELELVEEVTDKDREENRKRVLKKLKDMLRNCQKNWIR